MAKKQQRPKQALPKQSLKKSQLAKSSKTKPGSKKSSVAPVSKQRAIKRASHKLKSPKKAEMPKTKSSASKGGSLKQKGGLRQEKTKHDAKSKKSVKLQTRREPKRKAPHVRLPRKPREANREGGIPSMAATPPPVMMSLGLLSTGCGRYHPGCAQNGHCIECLEFGDHKCACGAAFHVVGS